MRINGITFKEEKFLRQQGFDNPYQLEVNLLPYNLNFTRNETLFHVKRVEEGELIVRSSDGMRYTINEPWLNTPQQIIQKAILELKIKNTKPLTGYSLWT